MEEKTEEKLGKTVIDGRIIDLDTASSEELKEYLKKIKQEEKDIQDEIDKILGVDGR